LITWRNPWISREAWSKIGIAACLLSAQYQVVCAADLTLYYYDRPPYTISNQIGGPTGYLIERTERALDKAGISYEWKFSSVNRIFTDLKEGQLQVCSPGWYTSPERRTYARFTKAIYHDLPLVGLTRSDSFLPESTTAAALLSRTDIKILLKQSVVYGAYLDPLLAKIPDANVLKTSTDFPRSVKMIRAKRADLAIVAQEEIDTFIKNADLDLNDFKIIHFSDVPGVEYRFILCSQAVSPDLITRINKAIDAVGLP